MTKNIIEKHLKDKIIKILMIREELANSSLEFVEAFKIWYEDDKFNIAVEIPQQLFCKSKFIMIKSFEDFWIKWEEFKKFKMFS